MLHKANEGVFFEKRHPMKVQPHGGRVLLSRLLVLIHHVPRLSVTGGGPPAQMDSSVLGNRAEGLKLLFAQRGEWLVKTTDQEGIASRRSGCIVLPRYIKLTGTSQPAR